MHLRFALPPPATTVARARHAFFYDLPSPTPPPPKQQQNSNDGKAGYGFALLPGRRPYQEDYAAAQWTKPPPPPANAGGGNGTTTSTSGSGGTVEEVGLFGVYDGHGGHFAAEYVRCNLFDNLLKKAHFPHGDAKRAIVEAFEETDAAYLALAGSGDGESGGSGSGDGDAAAAGAFPQQSEAGCTAVTAVLIGQRLLVANAGDSRAVLSRGGKAVALSVDHKPNLREERQRIEQAGGIVCWAGTWRVGGVLAVSRAFGDRPLKRFVTATPDVREELLTAKGAGAFAWLFRCGYSLLCEWFSHLDPSTLTASDNPSPLHARTRTHKTRNQQTTPSSSRPTASGTS
jgi:protein phosphatase 1L